MICQRCLQRQTLQPGPTLLIPRRFPLSSTTIHNHNVRLGNTRIRKASTAADAPPPAATSTSAAQPFSTPLTPSPDPPQIHKVSKSHAPPLPISSVPAGVPLKGLSYLKNKPDPVAEEESAYPAWLWRCLEPEGSADAKGGLVAADGSGAGEGDLFSKSKKQRRLAAKRQRKAASLHPELLLPKIPPEEQSVDLPANETGNLEGALAATVAREDITSRLRQKRRASIKEANFLKGMR
ncbi:MAG: hypothetical protein M1838_000531 [Thelocarpon superellum]|nr:MAG: hypothetical protein M1838_000531 [Thelocarpon superellum]